jgi:hypothetical protein
VVWRLDEHERGLSRLVAAERACAFAIRHRRELLRGYCTAVAGRSRRHGGLAPRRSARRRPRRRAHQFARSPRQTRGPDDSDGDPEPPTRRPGWAGCRFRRPAR